MPGVQVGVYPGQGVAGTQVSSTYEGRHITLNENELIHPFRASGFVNKGDPVIVCNAGVVASRGHAVGVAFLTATAVTDDIPIDTEGIFNLQVYAVDDGGNSAIVAGDPLYIHDGSAGAALGTGLGDCEISKVRNLATQIPFGYALGTVVAGGSGRIAVKVHWDPRQPRDEFVTVATTERGRRTTAYLAAGQSEGLSHYFSGQLSGIQPAGVIYNVGSWLDMAASFVAAAGQAIAPYEGGIWDDTADLTNAWLVYGAIHQAVLSASPAFLCAWRLNSNQVVDAVIQAGNPGSVGYLPNVGVTSNKVGDVPLFHIAAGPTPGYVRIYDARG